MDIFSLIFSLKFFGLYHIAGYFRGGNNSRLPSGAIIHEENIHECMALIKLLDLIERISTRENFHELRMCIQMKCSKCFMDKTVDYKIT